MARSTSQGDTGGSLVEAIERCLISARAGGLSTRTLSAYRYSANAFVAFLRSEDAFQPTVAHFTLELAEEWIESMLDDGRTARETIRSHVRRLRALSGRMYKRGLIATHALDGLITPKRVRTEVYVPSQRTVISMLSVCDHSTKSGQLDRALVSCIADCAARRSELVAADVRDVDWDLGVIRIRQPAKDGLARWAPLGRTAREDLRRYVGHRSSGPLFLDRRFNRLSGKACLHRVVDTSVRAGADRRIGPQLLRRFAATQMTACATPEPLLYRIMGWSPDPRKVAWPAYVDLGPTEIARAFATISPVDQLVF